MIIGNVMRLQFTQKKSMLKIEHLIKNNLEFQRSYFKAI